MNASTQNSSTLSDTPKARKAHLMAWLSLINVCPYKGKKTQSLTINAMKAEISLIEHQLRNRGYFQTEAVRLALPTNTAWSTPPTFGIESSQFRPFTYWQPLMSVICILFLLPYIARQSIIQKTWNAMSGLGSG